MESIRILYVEDNPVDWDLTRRHLARHAPHLKLTLAQTVAEALDRLAVGDVDVVLADYRLPNATGLDLLETIKARELPVPVVMVTGVGDVETAVRLLKAGAADYVVKRPGYLETLPAVLEGVFGWFQSVRALRGTEVRLLYAEHDPADVALARKALREHWLHFQLDVAETGREALERLKAVPYDLLLLDYRMPDLSGIELLKALREQGIRTPVVIVTGYQDEETAVQALKLGAADYILKREGYLAQLPSTLDHVLAQRRVADEKDALLVLNRLAASITSLQAHVQLGHRVAGAAADLLKAERSLLWLVDGPDLVPAGWYGIEESAAQALRIQMAEGSRDQATVKRRVVIPADPLTHPDRVLAVSLVTVGRTLGVLAVESHLPRQWTAAEERLLTILADHAAIAIDNARLVKNLRQALDDLKAAQDRLVQDETLRAVGEMAVLMAHHLNNFLAVILGRVQLVLLKVQEVEVRRALAIVERTTLEAAGVVRQLNEFTRVEPVSGTVPVDLNQLAREALEMTRARWQDEAQSRGVRIDASLDPGEIPPVAGEPEGLREALLSLLENAIDALAFGGRITVKTWASEQDVCCSVADSGVGMDDKVRRQALEPFFTTKGPKRLGLGLSVSYGIIRRHRGELDIESGTGRGAVVTIRLPLAVRI